MRLLFAVVMWALSIVPCNLVGWFFYWPWIVSLSWSGLSWRLQISGAMLSPICYSSPWSCGTSGCFPYCKRPPCSSCISSTCLELQSLLRQGVGAVVGVTTLSCLSEFIVVHYLVFELLRQFFFTCSIYFKYYLCTRVSPVPVTPSWSEVEIHWLFSLIFVKCCNFPFHFSVCSCFLLCLCSCVPRALDCMWLVRLGWPSVCQPVSSMFLAPYLLCE